MAVTLKLSRIGNSKGIRLPKRIIERYGFEEEILVEEQEDTLILKPVRKDSKLDWETTYKQMASADENWDEWDFASIDPDEGFSHEDW